MNGGIALAFLGEEGFPLWRVKRITLLRVASTRTSSSPRSQNTLCRGAEVANLAIRKITRQIPLAKLGAEIGSLRAAREIVVFCRSGVRSANAVRQLQAAGFSRVSHVAGGILRWSAEGNSAGRAD